MARSGQKSIAQGLPWVSRNRRFALKGLEMGTRSGSKVRSRFSLHPDGPFSFRADLGGGIKPVLTGLSLGYVFLAISGQ